MKSPDSGHTSSQKKKLKDLAREFLNADIQEKQHSSVIDARAALALYRMHYEEIETKFRCQEALEELQLQKVSSVEEKEAEDSNEAIKDIEFLMKNKKEIFNITPPNAKDEDKLKQSKQKYKLFTESGGDTWKGFKTSNIQRESLTSFRTEESSARNSVHIDPFSQHWTFSSSGQLDKSDKDDKIEISKFQLD